MRKITPGTILALSDAIKIIREQQTTIAELQRLLAAAAMRAAYGRS